MERIGKYKILSVLGRGGMGVVYKALDTKIDRVIALKTLSARLDSEPELRKRFQLEARSAAQLSHKNIITIFDYDEDNGLAYIAMEYLDGEDLKTVIKEKRKIPLKRKLEIMAAVCEGLSHAHRSGIIHRDVKPGNIFLTRSGQIKILDFGLARLAVSDITKSGISVGTPSYMSPEQVRAEKIDHRTDIFSAGAVFYELLTYERPFQGDSDFAISYKIVQTDPGRIDNIDPTIPPDLSAIVHRALEKSPETRYQSMQDLLSDLASVTETRQDETVRPGRRDFPSAGTETLVPGRKKPVSEEELDGERTEILKSDLTVQQSRPEGPVEASAILPPRWEKGGVPKAALWGAAGVLAAALAVGIAFWVGSGPVQVSESTAPAETPVEPLPIPDVPVEPAPVPEPATETRQPEPLPVRPTETPSQRRAQAPIEAPAAPVEPTGPADEARSKMSLARQGALDAGAAELASRWIEAARQAERQAGQLYQEKQFGRSAGLYLQAEEAYQQAKTHAQSEAARLAEAERRQKEEALAESRRKTALETGRRAEALFRQGQYPAAQAAARQWQALDPTNTRAQQILELLNELQGHVQAFQTAYEQKDYVAALNALQQAEKINPTNPVFAQLRQKLAAEAARNKPRPPPTLDREAAIRRRQGEEIYPLSVSHSHRFGSCSGEIVLKGGTVEYKSPESGHQYSAAIKELTLKIEDENIRFLNPADGSELESFRAEDASQAQSFRRMWERVKKTAR